MATAVTSSHDEYDPDDDPLFGRLVSIDLHDGDEPGHSWRDGLVAHVDTEIVDGIERATGVYNVVWGRFDRADDVMRVPADKREVRHRRRTPRTDIHAPHPPPQSCRNNCRVNSLLTPRPPISTLATVVRKNRHGPHADAGKATGSRQAQAGRARPGAA